MTLGTQFLALITPVELFTSAFLDAPTKFLTDRTDNVQPVYGGAQIR